MEIVHHDYLFYNLLINMDINALIILLQSSKKVNNKIITLLPKIIPILLENINYVDVEMLIYFLLENNKKTLAKQVLTIYRNNDKKADGKISDFIYDKNMQLFMDIAPDNFDWNYVANNVNDYILNNDLTEDIINNIFLPAMNADIEPLIRLFIDFWEYNYQEYTNSDIYDTMEVLTGEAKYIINY